jgi:hypothetical protein
MLAVSVSLRAESFERMVFRPAFSFFVALSAASAARLGSSSSLDSKIS